MCRARTHSPTPYPTTRGRDVCTHKGVLWRLKLCRDEQDRNDHPNLETTRPVQNPLGTETLGPVHRGSLLSSLHPWIPVSDLPDTPPITTRVQSLTRTGRTSIKTQIEVEGEEGPKTGLDRDVRGNGVGHETPNKEGCRRPSGPEGCTRRTRPSTPVRPEPHVSDTHPTRLRTEYLSRVEEIRHGPKDPEGDPAGTSQTPRTPTTDSW